jgi:putative endopeptidase
VHLKRLLLTTACALCLLPAAFADTATPLASGLDFAGFDPAVRPQDDLFRHVNGRWLDSTPFPPEYPLAGIVIDLYEQSQESLHAILVEAAAAGDKAGGVERKLGDFYASFLDEQRVEDLGIKPLQPLLDEIASIDSTAALSKFLGRARGLGLKVPVGIDVYPDKRNSGFNVAYLGQSGLGLPERDYYLKGDAEYVAFRSKYVEYLARLMTLAGIADGAERAVRILALETRLATDQWTPVQNRDPIATYNRYDAGTAAKLAPGIAWPALLSATGLPEGEFVIEQPSYFTALGAAMDAVPLADWRDYLTVRAIGAYARVLPAAFVEASFDFNSRTMRGTESLRPRWKRAVSEVDGSLGDALGQVYVARHFPPAAKARMDELVGNLLAAFGEGIDRLDWMGPETKQAAHEKLARMNVKIGYPDKWRDYSGLEVRRDDLFGNVMRSNQFEWDYQVARAGKPKDPTEWFMTPQTVNAYYMPMNNEIVFPAAYLQPPIFDMNVDAAANYGGIGSTIGHEISHAFDDKGRQYDGDGNLRDWWTAEDAARFKARAAGLISQYSGYAVLPGLNVNGELTLGENIGDLSGLTVAYRAYQRSLHGEEAPVIDGLTGDQRFFLSHAQINRTKWREGLLREVVLSDPHAPDEFRTNGVVSNMNEFYAAFGLKQGDKLWLPAEQRVSIW